MIKNVNINFDPLNPNYSDILKDFTRGTLDVMQMMHDTINPGFSAKPCSDCRDEDGDIIDTTAIIYDEVKIEPAIVLAGLPQVDFIDIENKIKNCIAIDTKNKVDKKIEEYLDEVPKDDECDVEITFSAKSIKDIVGDERYEEICNISDKMLDFASHIDSDHKLPPGRGGTTPIMFDVEPITVNDNDFIDTMKETINNDERGTSNTGNNQDD